MLEVSSPAIRSFTHVQWRRLARRVKWGALATYLVSIGAVVPLPFLGWVALASTAVALVAWVVEGASGSPLLAEGEAVAGKLVLADGKLRVVTQGREESIDPKTIEAGWTEEPDHVVLSLSNGRVLSVEVPDANARNALLAGLGVSAADRILRVPIYNMAGSLPGGELLMVLLCVLALPATYGLWTLLSALGWVLLLAGFSASALGIVLLMALLSAGATGLSGLLLGTLRRREVVIGTDGIVIEGFRRRVIPFSEVEHVSEDGGLVSVTTKKNEIVRLPTGRRDKMFPSAPTDEQATRARRILERAKEALALAGTSRLLDQKASWLESGGEDVSGWRARLSALGERVGDYRQPGISNQDLLDIARDGGRSADQRAGAFFVLGQRRADRKETEAAIATCADPALAGILHGALDGELTQKAARHGLRYRIIDAELDSREPEAPEAAEAEAQLRAERGQD